MTGGKSGDEDIDFPAIGLILLQIRVDDFLRVIVGDSYLMDDTERIGDHIEEIVRCVNDFSGGFV